jgi:riboflavin transporter FmnP
MSQLSDRFRGISIRLAAIVVGGSVIVSIFYLWLFGNFFYDLLRTFLDQHYASQSVVIAYTVAHIIPFLIAIIVVGSLYVIIRHELTQRSLLDR